LIIHLKRFEYKHSLRRDKLDHLVDFPLYGLDMNQHCGKISSTTNTSATTSSVDSTVPALYDCFAVVNHYGRMGFGHYTAYARAWNEQGFVSSSSTSISEDQWNLFDDSQVCPVHDERSVVSPAAYVLLYRRRIFH
jgi:ubiquitin C-terminal hydrolase